MRRRPEISYTQMAIYVDENIHKPNHDKEKIFDYLTMLAYMLAIKRRFFYQEVYYDKFAVYLATIVYMRIVKGDSIQKDKHGNILKEGDKYWVSPIKSCLNYMKQVLYVKKCQFAAEEFDYTTSDEDSNDAYKDYSSSLVTKTNNSLLVCDINIYLKTIDKIIWDRVKEGPYKTDRVLSWKIYNSCLLSLLRNFTASNKNKERISKCINKLSYDEELLSDIMYEESKSAPIVYDLDNKYLDYVAYILQKVKSDIVKDITELSYEYSLSDEMVEDILMTGMPLPEEEE